MCTDGRSDFNRRTAVLRDSLKSMRLKGRGFFGITFVHREHWSNISEVRSGTYREQGECIKQLSSLRMESKQKMLKLVFIYLSVRVYVLNCSHWRPCFFKRIVQYDQIDKDCNSELLTDLWILFYTAVNIFSERTNTQTLEFNFVPLWEVPMVRLMELYNEYNRPVDFYACKGTNPSQLNS
jgi:hypothetical protein